MSAPGRADDDAEIARLLERVRDGDGAAFGQLYERLGGKVTGYLRGLGVGEADDVVNDTFLGAFRAVGTFRGDAAAFRAWLFTIARNKGMDWLRATIRRPVPTDVERALAGAGDAEADAMARMEHDLTPYLERLTPDQRDVVMLRVVADLSLAEVAEVLDKPVGAVKSIQHRAFAALHRQLTAVSSDDETMSSP